MRLGRGTACALAYLLLRRSFVYNEMASFDSAKSVTAYEKELRIFFTALMFYTRIPCPKWVDHSQEYLNKATRYFPLTGWIVGAVNALVIYTFSFIFPSSICVIMTLGTSVLLTGAFHEDGYADLCDGWRRMDKVSNSRNYEG